MFNLTGRLGFVQISRVRSGPVQSGQPEQTGPARSGSVHEKPCIFYQMAAITQACCYYHLWGCY